MNIFRKIREFFNRLKEGCIEEVHVPLSKTTSKDVNKALLRERARLKGKVVRLEDKIRKIKEEETIEEGRNLKKEAKEKQISRIKRIIKEGHHRSYDGTYIVMSRDMKPIGKLISLIEYKGSTYVYVRLPDGGVTIYGEEGATKDKIIHYYRNFHKQTNIKWMEGIDGVIPINFKKGEKDSLIPDKYVTI